MTYDALDRVATKMLAPRSMTPADVALFGTYKTKYTWDYGAQRKGRLRYTQAYGAATGSGSTTATVSTDLQYDAWGNNTFINHTFNGAGFTGLTRQFGRRYQVGGREVLTYYRDNVGGSANETTATTDYDARGLPLQVKLSRTGITTQTGAVQTRNVAGLVTKRRTDQLAATGTMPCIESNWNYDVLARVTSQTVQKGSVGGGATATQVARQQLAYTGSDDPTSLVHTMGPTTAPNVRNLAFTYDARH